MIDPTPRPDVARPAPPLSPWALARVETLASLLERAHGAGLALLSVVAAVIGGIRWGQAMTGTGPAQPSVPAPAPEPQADPTAVELAADIADPRTLAATLALSNWVSAELRSDLLGALAHWGTHPTRVRDALDSATAADIAAMPQPLRYRVRAFQCRPMTEAEVAEVERMGDAAIKAARDAYEARAKAAWVEHLERAAAQVRVPAAAEGSAP